jgi:transposase-like protein
MDFPPFCPEESCPNHIHANGKWFNYKGYFKVAWNSQRERRFQCRTCGKKFSSATFKDTYRQHKPKLNIEIFKWYSSGASLRRMAKNLKTTRPTVTAKFERLADKARAIHAVEIITGNLKTDTVQFDEQETFLKTKLLPVSIAIAVDGRRIPRKNGGGKIIDIAVGTMPARGPKAKESQIRYGVQKDERPYICQTVLNNVRIATGGIITVTTDAKPAYEAYVKKIMPRASHIAHNRSEEKKQKISRAEEHPLWYVNQACAANRHDVSRLRRRTCVTSKDLHELRRHLWLYVAYRNEYQDHLFDPFFAVTTLRQAQAALAVG